MNNGETDSVMAIIKKLNVHAFFVILMEQMTNDCLLCTLMIASECLNEKNSRHVARHKPKGSL